MADPPASKPAPSRRAAAPWQRHAPVLLLLGAALALLVSGWRGYAAIDGARAQLEQAQTSPALVAALANQSRHGLAAVALGVVLLLGAALLLRHVIMRNRQDDAKRAGQQQLAALGRMSAVLAHEIRNPLASLKGHAQLLAEQLEEGSRAHRKAIRVVNEAMRLEVLTNSLLDFVRAGSVERREVDPCAVLERAVETVKSARITIETDGAPASFSLDPVRIEQLLVNLLRNALQADANARVTASLSCNDEGLVFKVRDTGPGLPAGGKHIFESFRTTKTRGTGLGLSVARRVVELHQGTITAVDLPSGGALFVVTLPPESA